VSSLKSRSETNSSLESTRDLTILLPLRRNAQCLMDAAEIVVHGVEHNHCGSESRTSFWNTDQADCCGERVKLRSWTKGASVSSASLPG